MTSRWLRCLRPVPRSAWGPSIYLRYNDDQCSLPTLEADLLKVAGTALQEMVEEAGGMMSRRLQPSLAKGLLGRRVVGKS